MTDGKRVIILQFMQEYDIQNALKDLLCRAIDYSGIL